MGDDADLDPHLDQHMGPDSVSRLDEALALLEEGLPL
jgi:hypothetical protein